MAGFVTTLHRTNDEIPFVLECLDPAGGKRKALLNGGILQISGIVLGTVKEVVEKVCAQTSIS